MGFFGDLLKGIGSVVGAVINPIGTITSLLGGDAKTAAVAASATAVVPAPKSVVELAGTDTPIRSAITGGLTALSALGLPLGVLPLAAGVIRPPTAGEAAVQRSGTMATGGNGRFAKRTIVQTINLENGAITNTVVLEGAPFLMNKAVRELARTTKKLKKAVKKIPTRTVEQSLSKKLTDKVLRQTIDDVGDHHHGPHS